MEENETQDLEQDTDLDEAPEEEPETDDSSEEPDYQAQLSEKDEKIKSLEKLIQKNKKEDKKEVKPEVTKDDLNIVRLESRNILDSDDQNFVLKYMRTEDVSMTDALNDPFVKSYLDNSKKVKSQKDATVAPSKRTGTGGAKDDVSYWARQLTQHGKSAPSAEMRSKVRRFLAKK